MRLQPLSEGHSGDLLQDLPNAISSSSILHDDVAAHTARIRSKAAAERSRRKQRQMSSQSSSLQNEPSVSSNAFMVQPGICLKRSEPVNTVCVMVVFPSLGTELQMRSFLESLDSEHASIVKLPAMLIDAIPFEESAATLTLKNTRKVQVQGPWLCRTELRSS